MYHDSKHVKLVYITDTCMCVLNVVLNLAGFVFACCAMQYTFLMSQVRSSAEGSQGSFFNSRTVISNP